MSSELTAKSSELALEPLEADWVEARTYHPVWLELPELHLGNQSKEDGDSKTERFLNTLGEGRTAYLKFSWSFGGTIAKLIL